MRQIMHHSRRISQFLIVGLLSCWVALTIGLLSYWLVVLRLIKSILKRKGKNETIERVKPSLVTDTGKSPVLSPEVESETHTVASQVEPEGSMLATGAIEAYCVKCRQRRMIQGAKKITTQKGRHAMEGTCPICGTKLFRFIAREKETLP